MASKIMLHKPFIKTPKLLLWITVISSIAIFVFIKPISQNEIYHHFANDNKVLGISNCWNVLSNIGFIITGSMGLLFIQKKKINNPIIWTLFTSVVLTGFGSAYYHFSPSNITLVWDRLPMTIVFTSFFALIYAWCFSEKMGFKIWIFSIAVGIYSVFYWQYTEHELRGDLRLYAIVQFLPILLIAIIVATNYKKNSFLLKPIGLIVLWYIIAKLLEQFDVYLFNITNLFSGHPIKHIAAAVATYYMYKMVKTKLVFDKANIDA